ncbi:MAG: hypothetical protein ACI8XO_002384 [Verrucomicrobiales bacterium]
MKMRVVRLLETTSSERQTTSHNQAIMPKSFQSGKRNLILLFCVTIRSETGSHWFRDAKTP